MKIPLFLSLLVAVALSLVVSKIVYFGFTPNYAADIFSKRAFKSRLDHDVYQYRVLSKYLLYAVDDWLGQSIPSNVAERRLFVYMQDPSERFYFALYYLNTFFLALTSIVLVLLLYLEDTFRCSTAEKALILFLVPVLIALSEFTVACYDVSSYFFQLLIVYLFLRFATRNYWVTIFISAALIFVSTLNRETSALSVSMIALLLFTRYGFTFSVIAAIGVLAAVFLATYIGLRYFIVDPQHWRIVNIQAGKLWIETNMAGILFWCLFFCLPIVMAENPENKWMIGAFFIFCLPYILTCLKDGVMWEVRLYIPLFLGALVLSKIDTSGNALSITKLYRGSRLAKSSNENSILGR